MSGDNVTAEIGVLTAELDAFAATMLDHRDAVEAQLDMLSWVVIAILTILTARTTAGMFRRSGWWPRGDAGSSPVA